MAIYVDKPQYENVSPGLHWGRLNAIVDRGIEDFGKGPQHTLQLVFITDQMNAAGTAPLTVNALCTPNLGRRSKLYKVAMVLLNGGPLPDEEKVDIESLLVGKECGLVISHRPSEKGGGVFAHIDSWLPASQVLPRPRSTPPPSTSQPSTSQPSTPQPTATVQSWRHEGGQDFDLPAIQN